MTSKKFNKEFKEICSKYSCESEPRHDTEIRYITDTPFGKMQIISDPSPRIKLYSIYFRFLEDFDISYFYRYFSKHETINKRTKKWNIHNRDSEYILNELEERLNNLKYILYHDGKVCGTQYKPFLKQIEN